MKITIDEIAKKAGVSISTISNVLNDKGKVSQEKRRKIKALALELGYFSDGKKTNKKGKISSKKIGVIFPRHSTASDPNYYLSEVLVGVEERVQEAGFSLMIESHQDEDKLPDLLEQDLDGLLLIGGQFPEKLILRLAELNFPIVTIGTSTIKTPMHSVLADNQMGAFQATSHLLQLGHRQIGMINGPETTGSSRSKYEGFREALLTYDLSPEKAWITSCDFTVENGYQAAQAFLSLKNRPTALFISDDPIAIGAIRAFQDAGLSVPGDISIIGFGNSPTAKYISPALTTIDVFQRKLGFHGAGQLLDLIEEDDQDSFRMIFSTKLVVRESCGMNDI